VGKETIKKRVSRRKWILVNNEDIQRKNKKSSTWRSKIFVEHIVMKGLFEI
jgi:hypothetical protein